MHRNLGACPHCWEKECECHLYRDTSMNTQRQIAALGGEGILREDDLPSFSDAENHILWLIQDGRWHLAPEIIRVSGQREGLRRLRGLRSKGFTIERRRVAESREFEYRLIPDVPSLESEQPELF